jgi:hypothetical protein
MLSYNANGFSSRSPLPKFYFIFGWWGIFFALKNVSQNFLSDKGNLGGGTRNFHNAMLEQI